MPTTLVHDFRTELILPPRPKMPSREDQDRADRQMLRWRMLNHQFAEDAAEFFEAAFGVENAQTMGIPDTTLAPLPAQTAQLTTPGLYQTPPTVTWRHSRGGAPVDAMLDPHQGALARCGYWSRMQHVMYHTVGIGNYALAVSAVQDVEGRWSPTLRSVEPHNLVVWCRAEDPMVPVKTAEMRVRSITTAAGTLRKVGWFWDIYDISDPGAPTFAVINATDPQDNRNYADLFVPGFAGDYTWLSPDGVPFIPYGFYHATDTGTFWNEYRPGLRHGTLRAVANWTMTGQAALWSQGNCNMVGGVDPMALPADLQMGHRSVHQGAPPLLTMKVTPGRMMFIPVEDEKQLQVFPMTAGVDLSKMVDWSNAYSMNLATVDGMMPSDATRRSANPTSGSALAIAQTDKRAFAAVVTPVFRRADLDAIRKIAWTMSAVTGDLHEGEGYSVTYKEIPLTPTEQADLRDQLEWEEDQGMRSPVDVYLALHPGTTREQAIDAIVEAKVDEARIDQIVSDRLAEEGLTPQAPPAVPPPMPATDAGVPADNSGDQTLDPNTEE